MRRHRGHWAALLGVVIAALATFGAAIAAGATGSRGVGTRLLGRCDAIALGLGGSRAAAAPGSADAGVEAQFALLRRPRTAADALPTGAEVPLILSTGGAGNFDPAASVKVESLPHHAALYAVPATVRASVLPAGCASLPQGPDLAGLVALDAEAVGSGPGVCLVTVGRPTLVGISDARPPRVVATEASCASATVLAGYPGATGLHGEAASSPFLVPDGITSLTDTFADGRQVTIPVSGNLARAPRVKAPSSDSTRTTVAQLRADLMAALPTTVTEVGAAGAPVATLARPDDLVGNLVASFRLLRSALRRLIGTATSTGSSGATVSCQSGTHRCTSVTLSSTCHSGPSGGSSGGAGGGPPRCRLDRRIRRFRSFGSKPPGHAGAPNPLLTAPIRARLTRTVTHPGKLALVLKGAPQDHVGVFASVNCFSGASAASGNPGLPIIDAAVPSRTPLTLPGPAATHRTCVVNALVTSTRHDAIHVTVARG